MSSKGGRFRVEIATDGGVPAKCGMRCRVPALPWLREAALPLRGSAAWERDVFSRERRTYWEEVIGNTPLITQRHLLEK